MRRWMLGTLLAVAGSSPLTISDDDDPTTAFSMGLSKAAEGPGDLLVCFHAAVNRRIDVTPTTTSFGYGGATSANEVGTCDEDLIWRGTARAKVQPSLERYPRKP